MDFKSKIILISGPTASGKSHFAIKLAKKIQGEIINADSMQVYKQLKVLSARPNLKNYQKITPTRLRQGKPCESCPATKPTKLFVPDLLCPRLCP